MGESDTPKSQDKTANHVDNPAGRGTLGTNTAPWWRRELEVLKFVAEVVILVVTIRIAFIYAGQLEEMKKVTKSSEATVTWIQNQTRQAFPRPNIWVKMPATIKIEADKPIRPDIQIFNYGDRTGFARASIFFKVGPGAIEDFRKTILNDSKAFDTDTMETIRAAILPNDGRYFPVRPSEVTLNREQIKDLSSGAIDVAIFGRIFYTDLALKADGSRFETDHVSPAYYGSLFCFYVMRDGKTISACPNQRKPEAYTNWAP